MNRDHVYLILKTKYYKVITQKTTQSEFVFTDSQLCTRLQVKGKMKFERNHDFVYLGTCPENNCSDNYVGESARRISERIIDQSGRN